ncbi:helicase-1 [Choristoneura occidentalis granulovirus]|uniref:Helicase-1 n=2 Tax=Betabaculovirus chofumiferanae TaxID=3051997 RepID=Q1A4M5_9BBAC|nr:helicase-1 [Choristoneura fumiferana granulovirus]ABC61205.1 helicase-1 [Choristoneura fumiferana granulovirus]
MSVEDIMNSYENVNETKNLSHNYWYFRNSQNKMVRHQCNDAVFFFKLLMSTLPTQHTWSMVPNFCSTRVIPFIPYKDYLDLLSKNPNMFEFKTLRNNDIGKVLRVGEYMVWPELSANFLGWTLYLFINMGYKLPALIPLCHHHDLGNFNLLSNNNHNIDISCKIVRGDQLLFTNTATVPKYEVLTFDSDTRIYFGSEYVFSKKMWFDFLVNDDSIKTGTFLPDYQFVCQSIDFESLRWIDPCIIPSPFDVEMNNNNTIDTLSPCSKFEIDINNTVDECLKVINEMMLAKCSPSLNNENILKFYLTNNKYSTLYILIICIWQYCEATIKMHNQYELEDILYFVKTLCEKLTSDETVFIDHTVYFSTEKMAKNFLNSLQFFVTPDHGMEQFFDSVSAYFALHLSIFKKTGVWSINSSSIKEASDVDITTKSVGFYKKIKINKFDYIFTGGIYENYKNKKDHTIAGIYSACPEVTVSELVFNKTLNFYMTQSGLFDVCKKIYKEPCPFIVMSTLKKNFISKNQTYLEKDTFKQLYNSINMDLTLLKIYHARKFLVEFYNVVNNINDCQVVGEKMSTVRQDLIFKWKELVGWLLDCKGTDIVLLILKLKDQLTQPIGNIISLAVNVDVLGLKAAIICHLLWPNSSIEKFFWALLCSHYHDFEDWLEGCDFEVSENVFKNKKKITEGMIYILKRVEYGEDNMDGRVKEMIRNAGECDDKKYEYLRILKNVGSYYKKYEKIVNEYNVWSDVLIEYRKNESMYNWLTRFYIRMFLRDLPGNVSEISNVVMGYTYFRVFTNYHTNNSKALINFCASLIIPFDYEKMCIVLSSKPNCGKSSLWELLSTIILVYKQDKEHYKHNKNEKDEKVKKYESQLYVMNEAQLITKAYLKGIVDSTKIDQARCNYGVMEKFNSTYKTLICNNDEDKIFVTDGYDRACSNRLGQMYFDHEFNESKPFSGSVYEHHIRKRYCEERDIVSKLAEPVKAFLANVVMYNCDPNDGQLYYKCILQGDNSYKYNKKCLYIYNTTLEALLYVMNVKECKSAPEFSEEKLIDLIKCAEKYVPHMLHYKRRKHVSVDVLCAEFRRKYNSSSRFYNSDTKMYNGLQISLDEKYFMKFPPKFKANVDEDV